MSLTSIKTQTSDMTAALSDSLIQLSQIKKEYQKYKQLDVKDRPIGEIRSLMDRCHDLFESIREVANTYSPDVVPQGIENMMMLTVELRQLLKQQDADITKVQLRDLLVKVSEQMGTVRSLIPPPPLPPSRKPAPPLPHRLPPPSLPASSTQDKSHLGVPAIGRSPSVTASFMAELNGKLRPGTKDRRTVEDDNDTPPNYPPPPPPVELDELVTPLKAEDASNAGKPLTHLQLARPQFKGRRPPTRKQPLPIAHIGKIQSDDLVVVLPSAKLDLSAASSSVVIVEVRQEPEQIALLRQALDAFESGKKEDGQEIISMLSERFPDTTKPIFSTVYTEAKKEGKKYAAQLGHPKFGRVAFFGKDKCDVSSNIRITAVRAALESELCKL